MSYIPIIVDKNKNKGKLQVVVEFSNGTDQFKETFLPTSLEHLRNLVRSRVRQLSELENEFISMGELDISTPAPQVPTQTQDQLDLVEYQTKLERLVALQKGVKLGILDSSHNQITALTDFLKSNFKVAYIPLLDQLD